jgi:serine/threonine protein kinase
MAHLGNINGQQHDIFSAMYGGYSGTPSLPQPLLLTSTYWDEQKIIETLTPSFIRRSIPEQSRKRLDEQLTFGEGLTECTYAEWIVEKTAKIFLILVEINAAEKIFDLIDESWDDDDLPFSEDSLGRLPLSAGMGKKFLKKQHLFMVRDLEPGGHIDYTDEEVVPLEVIYHRHLPAARSNPAIEKVYFPRQRDVYYSRRRVSIGESASSLTREALLEEIRTMREVTHPHIVGIHATYTQGHFGYILLSPTIEQTLKTFIAYTPSSFKALTKDRRKLLLIDWLHCLSDALAYLHEEGFAHGDIKPSSIIVDHANKIYFADIGNSKTFEMKAPNVLDVENYEYGAPELWVRTMTTHEAAPIPAITISGRLRTRRRRSQIVSLDSPPCSPTSGGAVHLGTWKSPTATDHWNCDVFSLACVFVDILTFYAKKKSSAFISHRSSKHRRPRESAPPDASFHANMGQVESWLDGIEKRATDKKDDALSGCLKITREMLQRDPVGRPSARRVEKELYKIVLGMTDEELPHCGVHTLVGKEVDGEEGEGEADGLGLLGGWPSGTDSSGTLVEGDEVDFGEVKSGGFWKMGSLRSSFSSGKSKRSTGSSSGRLSIAIAL